MNDLLLIEEVSRHKIGLYNSILGTHRLNRFEHNGHLINFSFCLHKPEYKPSHFFKIKLSNYHLGLVIGNFPALGNLDPQIESVHLESLPEEIQPVLIEHLFDKILDNLEKNLGTTIALEKYWKEDSFAKENELQHLEEELHFTLNIQGSKEMIYGTLKMPSPALEFLAVICDRKLAKPKNYFSNVAFNLTVEIADSTLSTDEFRNLEVSDIVLFENAQLLNEGKCHIRLQNSILFSGIFQKGVVTIKAVMDKNLEDTDREEEDFYEDEDQASLQDDQNKGQEEEDDDDEASSDNDFEEGSSTPSHSVPDAMKGLPISLTFEVGRKTIPLQELNSIKPGYSFELDNLADTPVSIHANGRLIGHGELLKIEDRVGVRVKSFKKA